MPITMLLDHPIYFVLWIGAILISLTIHEFSHAWAGYLQGDSTAEQEGRLTLNPIRHVDLMGLILLIVAGFGWAKPTPFNPYNLKNQKYGPLLIALAGPISNGIMALALAAALWVVLRFTNLTPDNLMVIFFFLLIQINVTLAVFNLLPIPPLDGSRVLFWRLEHTRPDVIQFLERYGIFLLFILVFFFSNQLGWLFNTVYEFIVRLIV